MTTLDLAAIEADLQRQLDRTRRMPTEPMISIRAETLRGLIAAVKELSSIISAYRRSYGCLACGENHDETMMCPPFEVRATGMSWSRERLKQAVNRAERAEAALASIASLADGRLLK